MSQSTRLLRQFIHTSSHRPCLSASSSRLLPQCTHLHTPRCRGKLLTQTRRTFSSSPVTHALRSSRIEGEPAELAATPSPELKDEIDLVPVDQATLQLTRRAAEQLKSISEKRQNSEVGLRVRVDSGGCHGYHVFSHRELKPSNVYIDAVSLALMKGSVIDYATELIGSSFRVNENPQAKGSGCGCGVSWELKDEVTL
ncbi:hypothetical protein BXZ70DRAFT_738781 [Cristinia sonorae]|uniref:FeS cluster biogenesis domain-containing protein n=1 Tax=Cristinia sonorae TaxID=1940300 RepID=A0A8K0UT92_9AGAR|nr:hypothetical protein BXZ70DRAFT_738781 [Cristinia sonorae]